MSRSAHQEFCERVISQLAARGISAFYEFPGYIAVPVKGDERAGMEKSGLAVGDVDGPWTYTFYADEEKGIVSCEEMIENAELPSACSAEELTRLIVRAFKWHAPKALVERLALDDDDEERTDVRMTERERATVLAALAYYTAMHLRAGRMPTNADIDGIASNAETLTPLTAQEINELAERLNFGEVDASSGETKAQHACRLLVAFANSNNRLNLTGKLGEAVATAREVVEGGAS